MAKSSHELLLHVLRYSNAPTKKLYIRNDLSAQFHNSVLHVKSGSFVNTFLNL